MFQKRIIELIVVLLYWMVITPAVYKICKDKNIIQVDMNHLLDTVAEHCTFGLCLMVAYVILYRIVIFIYMKLKVCDIQMWHNLKKTQEDPEANLSKKSHYQAVSTENIDTVDSGKKRPMTPKMIRTISNPLLIESDLARIHVKHETRPLQSATLPRLQRAQVHASPSPSLRCAPPVPMQPPNVYNQGVIMSPKVLMPRHPDMV
ncbi:uncharacterized protein LOC111072542 [Drosophila obscura]|uniref:uncharacterized protein LOC111072542 n=1 Tax=Drosophila obscura TaxID=7282 RepID=UPI001BB228F3|nr:uncharacterized protein LOC111072542 [Drosophila obscura]